MLKLNYMREKVEKVLHFIKPNLELHGGDIELVEVDERNGIVKIRLTGGCVFCPMAEMTLKNTVEKILKKEIPKIKEVITV